MTTILPAPPKHRFGFLDGLRGTAAAVVVVYHVIELCFGWAALERLLSFCGFLLNGTFSVAVFFVLSGFVLSQSVVGKKKSVILLGVTRYLRLTVPMTAALIMAYVLYAAFNSSVVPGGSVRATLPLALRDGLWHVYQTGHSKLNDPLWTMRIEFLGSIGIYVVCGWVPDRFRLGALAVFGLLTMIDPLYVGFPMGALLREAWERNLLRGAAWAWMTVPLSFLLSLGNAPNEFAGNCLGAWFLIVTFFLLPKLKDVFENRVFRFLGRISFGVYLVHKPLLNVLRKLFPTLPPMERFGVLLLLCVIATLVVATLLTIILDEPLIKALHKLKAMKLPAFGRIAAHGRES